MRSTTSPKIIAALTEIFARFGYPYSLKADNGPQFESREFEVFLCECGIEHRRSPPIWPQANGEVERQNRTLFMRNLGHEKKSQHVLITSVILRQSFLSAMKGIISTRTVGMCPCSYF